MDEEHGQAGRRADHQKEVACDQELLPPRLDSQKLSKHLLTITICAANRYGMKGPAFGEDAEETLKFLRRAPTQITSAEKKIRKEVLRQCKDESFQAILGLPRKCFPPPSLAFSSSFRDYDDASKQHKMFDYRPALIIAEKHANAKHVPGPKPATYFPPTTSTLYQTWSCGDRITRETCDGSAGGSNGDGDGHGADHMWGCSCDHCATRFQSQPAGKEIPCLDLFEGRYRTRIWRKPALYTHPQGSPLTREKTLQQTQGTWSKLVTCAQKAKDVRLQHSPQESNPGSEQTLAALGEVNANPTTDAMKSSKIDIDNNAVAEGHFTNEQSTKRASVKAHLPKPTSYTKVKVKAPTSQTDVANTEQSSEHSKHLIDSKVIFSRIAFKNVCVEDAQTVAPVSQGHTNESTSKSSYSDVLKAPTTKTSSHTSITTDEATSSRSDSGPGQQCDAYSLAPLAQSEPRTEAHVSRTAKVFSEPRACSPGLLLSWAELSDLDERDKPTHEHVMTSDHARNLGLIHGYEAGRSHVEPERSLFEEQYKQTQVQNCSEGQGSLAQMEAVSAESLRTLSASCSSSAHEASTQTANASDIGASTSKRSDSPRGARTRRLLQNPISQLRQSRKEKRKKRLTADEIFNSLIRPRSQLRDIGPDMPSVPIAQMDGPAEWRPRGKLPYGHQAVSLTGANSIAVAVRARTGLSGHSASSRSNTTKEPHIASTTSLSVPVSEPTQQIETNMPGNRYEDGEVRRYGAGESYRPFNRDRSPRPARSPSRDRERARSPPGASDRYVPARSPRRRSRTPDRADRGDRYRHRDRSREGESWRRRDRSTSRNQARGPLRRLSPRRSPPRYASPRRDERNDRVRSPRRDYDARDFRRRSRSPYDRDRPSRARTPLRRTPPTGPRGGSYRPRSRTPERRDDRQGSSYRRPSPLPRESLNSSAMPSRSASGPSSPRPNSYRDRDDRSRPVSRSRSPPGGVRGAHASQPAREARNQVTTENSTRASTPATMPTRSPPRGPAALRAPPTGPSASRNFTAPAASPGLQQVRYPQTPAGHSSRSDMTSPTIPPSGPRGYVPPQRGGAFAARGARGAWSSAPSRHAAVPSAPSAAPPAGPSGIPTGPRAASASVKAASPSLASKPFNPPTGPAAHNPPPRPSLAQNLLASMPVIIPGGKLDPSASVSVSGVVKELDSHHRKLKEEEERIREELRVGQERLRRQLRIWDKVERESRLHGLKTDLAERSLQTLAGDGLGGAAF